VAESRRCVRTRAGPYSPPGFLVNELRHHGPACMGPVFFLLAPAFAQEERSDQGSRRAHDHSHGASHDAHRRKGGPLPPPDPVLSINSAVAKIGVLDTAGADTRSGQGNGLGRRNGASFRVTHRA
jgi:hypothetical protein